MKEAEISVGGSIVAVADTGDCYVPTGLRWFMSQFADEYFIYGSPKTMSGNYLRLKTTHQYNVHTLLIGI